MNNEDGAWDFLNGNIYNEKLFDVSECIMDHGSDRGKIVSYAVYCEGENKNDEYYEYRIIADYLQSAGKLIDTITREDNGLLNPHAGDDAIALPLLFLYTHSLELTLKMLYRSIINSGIDFGVDFVKNDMKTHDLKYLIEKIKNIFPKEHSSSEFVDMFRFIESIYDTGLKSVDIRYCQDSNNNVNLIRQKQLYIDPVKLHKSIIYIFNRVVKYLKEKIW